MISRGSVRKPVFIVVVAIVVLSFTLISLSRFSTRFQEVRPADDSNNLDTPITPITTPIAAPITTPTTIHIAVPIAAPTRPVPTPIADVKPPAPCRPDLRYKPQFKNTTVDEYMELAEGCNHLEFDEETFTDVGCTSNDPINFWIMWTTRREGWKLKHYRVLDNIYFHHPNATIHMITHNMTADDFSFYISRFKLVLHPLDVYTIFKYTPLARWVQNSMQNPKIREHKNFYSHLTDAMRLALLWKYGGVYLDTDAILLRPINKIRNALGYQAGGEGQELNAILIFDRRHPFLYFAMHLLIRTYDVTRWIVAGPGLLTHGVMSWSQLDPMMVRWIPSPFIIDGNVTLPNEPLGTAAISVFTDKFQFYPWSDSGRADIQRNHSREPELRNNVNMRTYVYHYYNYMLEIWKKKIEPGTLLFDLMNKGCLVACNNTNVETPIKDIIF